RRSSGRYPMPSRARMYELIPSSMVPSRSMRPELGRVIPMMLRNVVVLPAPLRPTSATMVLRSTARLRPRRMVTALIATVSSSTRSMLFLAEDGAADVAAREHVCHRAVGYDPAAVECHGALRITLDDLHVVLHENRGDMARRERRRQRVHD